MHSLDMWVVVSCFHVGIIIHVVSYSDCLRPEEILGTIILTERYCTVVLVLRIIFPSPRIRIVNLFLRL